MEVTPWAMRFHPSLRSGIMPSRMARSRSSEAGARRWMSSWRRVLMRQISKSAVRPEYPELRHLSQPTGRRILSVHSIGKPISAKRSGLYFPGWEQCGQRRRTRRWAMKARTEEPTRNGSTPISRRRVMPPTASFVWSVLKTRWPVSAARMAISVVSRSRISPTMTTFGSPRRMLRSAVAKVRSISGFTAIWMTPSSLFSTGSSIVTMRRSLTLRLLRKV